MPITNLLKTYLPVGAVATALILALTAGAKVSQIESLAPRVEEDRAEIQKLKDHREIITLDVQELKTELRHQSEALERIERRLGTRP